MRSLNEGVRGKQRPGEEWSEPPGCCVGPRVWPWMKVGFLRALLLRLALCIHKKAASLRAAEQQAVRAMAAEVHFSPPEIPEPTLLENVLRYGLFFGAIFQLLCVLAIILPVSKSPEADSVGSESKTLEAVKKPKASSAAQLSKKAKKEGKKRR
uniref:Mannosidase beta like n=2 Tax=Gallus gallus TaxID=9031 RepID=A0A8V0ZP43_CHICK